jgi:very-short-patch-repair endonuclease
MSDLRNISITKGLEPPADEAAKFFAFGCCDHHKQPSITEMALAAKPHRWKELRDEQKEAFADYMQLVTEYEKDMLSLLRLPKIEVVREYVLTGEGNETGQFVFDRRMNDGISRIIAEWMDALFGKRKKIVGLKADDDFPVFDQHAGRAYVIGVERTKKEMIAQLPDGMPEEYVAGIMLDPEERYYKAMITTAMKNVKRRFEKDVYKQLVSALVDMAQNGEYPLKVARYLHKKFEGEAWYWNRLARSEAVLATNAAHNAMAEKNKTAFEQWASAPNACPICAHFHGQTWKRGEGPEPVASTHPHCFEKYTPVYTLTGWKAIDKIELGEQVLTHTGKFQNVTKLHRHTAKNGQIITIVYKNDPYSKKDEGAEISLSATDNHPFLVNDKWVQASQIRAGDSVRLLATRCESCGKLIPFARWRSRNGKEAKHCSAKCQMDALRKERGTEYLLRKFRENGRRMVANNQHHFQKRKGEILSLANSENSRRKYNTQAEQILNAVLSDMGINFIHQYKINRPLKRKCGRGGEMNRFYKADFYLPDHQLAIECDGKQWGRDIEYDKNRLDYIRSTGIDVLQLKNEFVINNTGECVQAIQRMVKNHSGEYEFIDVEVVSAITHKIERVTLYNLSVAEDESYIAKGFVVHNCGCTRIPLYGWDGAVQDKFNRDPYEERYTPDELAFFRDNPGARG